MQQQRSFLDQVLCAMKSGFYMIAGDNHLSGGTEKKLQSTSQSQTSTPKRSWSLFGGLLPIWSTTDFWILVKLLHLWSMLSKSVRGTENCNTCSWHWSAERAQFFPKTMPNHKSYNKASKVEWIGLWSFTSSPILTWPLADYHFFKHIDNVLQGEHFHNQ